MNDIEMIPLGKLRLSEANVRKNDSNLFIEELAANIEAKGLLQNLIVAPAKKRGMFDVTAGGRRLRALNFLLEAGKLAKDHRRITAEGLEQEEHQQQHPQQGGQHLPESADQVSEHGEQV